MLKDSKTPFGKAEQPPEDIALLLKKACFDCHSNLTDLPWYAKIPVAKGLVNDHVKEGKEHMNFSLWDTYTADQREDLLLESAEEIKQGSMPLKSYATMHNDANLTEFEKERIIDWFGKAADKYSNGSF